jgi:cyclopropane fatty-acyl-phospholipid synthase-like methyltransferase
MMAKANYPEDVWAGGGAYESYMGRWSSLVSEQFLSWLAVPPGSRWLDVGCGTGELSLFLARHGHDVLGIDLSSLAIEQATDKAQWRRIDAQFLVWDALDLSRLREAGFSFRTVVDSAMFHILGDGERDRFVDGLGDVVPSGGLYCVLGDARRSSHDIYGITPQEIQRRFSQADGWEVAFVFQLLFERRWSSTPASFVGVQLL